MALGFHATAAVAQVNCEMGEPAADMPEGFQQFDFIVGDFVVHASRMTQEGWSGSIPIARWNGRYGLNGRAIIDWWHETSESGINIRMYDETDNLWKTAWHYTANQEVRELHQKIDPETGNMKLWQVYPDAPERRVHFETYEDGRWARIDGRQHPDTGEWGPVNRLMAIPVPCEAGRSHIIPAN